MWQGRYLLSAWINVSIYEYFCHGELRGFLPRRWVGAVKILGSKGRWNGGLGECVPHQKLFAGERAPAVSKVKTVVCQVHTSSPWESSITNKTDAPVGQMWRWTAHAPFFPLLTHRLKNPSSQKPKSLLFFNHTLHAPCPKAFRDSGQHLPSRTWIISVPHGVWLVLSFVFPITALCSQADCLFLKGTACILCPCGS